MMMQGVAWSPSERVAHLGFEIRCKDGHIAHQHVRREFGREAVHTPASLHWSAHLQGATVSTAVAGRSLVPL